MAEEKQFARRFGAAVLLAASFAAAPLLVGSVQADAVTTTVGVGNTPYGVAFAPDGATAYITNAGSNSLSMIDVASTTVTGSISVGSAPFDVAVTPNGATAFVTNFSDSSVSVVDLTTNTVLSTLVFSTTTYRVAVSPNGAKAYVTHFDPTGSVDVIDVASGTVTATLVFDAWLGDVAFAPNGTSAYVAGAGGITVIDVATDTISSTIAGVEATGLVVSPDSSVLYASGGGIASLLAIDVISGTVVSTIPVGSLPRGVDVTTDGTKVYVVNTNSNTVSVVDTATATVTATIAVGGVPLGVAFGPSGNPAYVTNSDDGTISVLRVDLLAVLVPQTPVPSANRGSAYSFATAASLGTPAAAFSISANALPPGLSIDPVSGIISGIPTAEGIFAFTVTALNAAGSASNDYSITVGAALPPTGVEVQPVLFLASALLLAGALTLALRRQRRVH